MMAGKALNIFLLTFPLLLSVILIARKVVEFRRRKVWIAIATSVSVLVFVLLPKSLNKDDSRMYSPYKVYYEINSPFYSVRYFGLAEMMTKDVYRYLTGFEEKTVIIVPSGTEFIGDDEKEYNVTDIDFSGMSASESRETIAAMHKYFASVEPTEKNDYTGIFEGKNLIYIVAEALCYGGIDPDMTPTLYKMTTEGINFTNYYSPLYYASTFDGEYMTLLSLIPSDGEWSLYTARNNSLPYSYGNAFRKLGYRSEAYHGWWYDYYYRDETHPNLGYVWNAVGSGLDVDANYWPPSDVEVVEKSVPEYISDSPFMVYYLSISGHLGYTFSGNTMSTKHKSEVADLPYSEPVRAYYACQKEFDDSLALLLKDLEEQGILDDTVIVISNDHYPYGLMTDEMEEFCDYIEDEKFDIHKGVFLIYNSATDGEQVDTVCSSLDALPTVSNMFGLEYDSRLVMGTDVMSEKEPVAIFSDRSWKTSSGTYDASTETFRKARLAEIDSNYIDTIKNRVYYAFLMSKYILEYDYYRLVS
ncbi:MAG: LTA synthase family protein [Oscillospiraceae bacterium]|nr:LTA synthase family protein [Oscillospiraceae bacterium]